MLNASESPVLQSWLSNSTASSIFSVADVSLLSLSTNHSGVADDAASVALPRIKALTSFHPSLAPTYTQRPKKAV